MKMVDPTSAENAQPDENVAAADAVGNSAAKGAICFEHPVVLSFGRRADDNRPLARTMTLGELIREFSTADTSRGTLTAAEYHALDEAVPAEKVIRNREKDGRYFIPCQLMGDGRRCNANVETLSGIALDFDSGRTTKADIGDRLNGYAYLAYTTYSHRDDKQKWRVFIPYQQPIAAAQHPIVYSHFQKLFEGDIDAHCATPCQFSYTPSCPPDATDQFECFHALGELFDPSRLEATPKQNNDAGAGGTSERSSGDQRETLRRVVEALTFVSSDERKIWVEFGMAIKHDLGEFGLSAWLTWSEKSPKFELQDALKTWASFKNDTKGPKITLGSIFYMAHERGWVDSAAAGFVPEHITRLNEHYFLAPLSGKTLIFKEGNDPRDGRQTLQPMSIPDFKALFTSERVDAIDAHSKHKRVSVAEAWLLDPKHRQYEGVLLAPNLEMPEYYNLWRGFAVERCPGSWQLMREHIRAILCNGDAKVFEYVLNWLARVVQYPDRAAEVAVVLCGGRGAGKGMFARAVGSLFGQHFRQISHARHLTGNFNAHLADCILLFVDEAFWAGDKQGESVLKHLITEPTLPIERKGLDVEMAPNMLHVIMASNNMWVVPAGLDERRYLVLAVNDSMKQNAAYFTAIQEELDGGGYEAMLHDLLEHDISSFNHRNAPRTKALVDQKIFSLDPTQQWYFERLQHGTLTGFMGDWELVSTRRVQDHYISCMKDVGSGRRALETELGMRLRRLLPPGYPRVVKASTLIEAIPVQAPHYRLPPLEMCRKYFAELLGLEAYDWEVGDVEL